MSPLFILLVVGLVAVQGRKTEQPVLSPGTTQLLRNVILASGKISDDKPCTDCLQFLGDIKTVVSSKPFADAIAGQVGVGCAILGQSKDVCEQLLAGIINTVLSSTAQFINPPLTCGLLQFCTATPPLTY